MLGAGLWLFDEIVPFGKWLRAALGTIAAWIGRNPLLAVIVALLCISGWLWHRGNVATDRLTAIQAAQKTATAEQAAVNHEPARVSGEIARRSDVDAQTYYEAGRSAGATYADAHRVRDPACPARGPDLPGADSPQQGNDGPGEAADMVALSRPDFDLLTGNSLRLAKVRQDAEALIAGGVAVASAVADVPPE